VQVQVSSSQTAVILQDLLADAEYSVIVTAITNSSRGLPSPAVTVRTLPGKSNAQRQQQQQQRQQAQQQQLYY